jgi:hypothetical protein
MAQHPGDGHDRRDRQSVFVHLADLVDARDLADYENRALAWGRGVWQTWARHHELIRQAVTSCLR